MSIQFDKEIPCKDCGQLFISKNVRTVRCGSCKESYKYTPKRHDKFCIGCGLAFATTRKVSVVCSNDCYQRVKDTDNFYNAKPQIEQEKEQRKIERMRKKEEKQKRSDEKWMSTEKLVNLMKESWGDCYDYSQVEYKGREHHVTVVCPDHGECVHKYDHYRRNSTPCLQCYFGKRKTHKEFIEECREKFGSKYRYISEYQHGDKGVINFICPDHGEQLMTCRGHLVSDTGCPGCTMDSTDFNRNPFGAINHKTCSRNPDEIISLYVLRLVNRDSEEYFKVGLSRNVDKRLKAIKSFHADVELLHIEEGLIGDMFSIEQSILDKSTRVQPSVKFGGHTECIQENPMEYLQEVKNELV